MSASCTSVHMCMLAHGPWRGCDLQSESNILAPISLRSFSQCTALCGIAEESSFCPSFSSRRKCSLVSLARSQALQPPAIKVARFSTLRLCDKKHDCVTRVFLTIMTVVGEDRAKQLPIGMMENQSVDYHLVRIFERLDALRSAEAANGSGTTGSGVVDGAGGCAPQALNSTVAASQVPMRLEIRSLEFWRSVTCECLASCIYVFIVCGAAAGAGPGASLASVLLATALSAGFAMTTLTQCFGHISGAHINPAVSIAMGVTKKITILRSGMFVIAQCGGAIAGTAFLYGVTVPGYQGNLSIAVAHTVNVNAWERFAVEFLLTFVVVLTYFVSMDTHRKWLGSSSLAIGCAYSACTFVSMPYLNPARSLGPSFVLSKWTNHWIYWLGPTIGACFSGLMYDYILNPRRPGKHAKKTIVNTSNDADTTSSVNSDEDNYDDLDKTHQVANYAGSTYNTYRSTSGMAAGVNYCTSLNSASLYSALPPKMERVESLYGGTKSLYCKSPPLTRANLNRSQSVYTKSNTAVVRDNREGNLPRAGPLLPAQSLYPMQLSHSQHPHQHQQQPSQSHTQNQNVQNQMQQHSDSIYGVRGVTPGNASCRENYTSTAGMDRTVPQQIKPPAPPVVTNRTTRPESMYGSRRGQSERSDDSSYGSCGPSSTRLGPSGGPLIGNYLLTANGANSGYVCPKTNSTYTSAGPRAIVGTEQMPSPNNPIVATSTSSYHRTLQHSPPSQY